MSIYILLIILLVIDRLVAILNSLIFKIKYTPLIINSGINKTHQKFVGYYIAVMSSFIMVFVLISIFVNSPYEKVFDPYPYWTFIFVMGLIAQQIIFELKFIKEGKQYKATWIRGFVHVVLLLNFVFY